MEQVRCSETLICREFALLSSGQTVTALGNIKHVHIIEVTVGALSDKSSAKPVDAFNLLSDSEGFLVVDGLNMKKLVKCKLDPCYPMLHC